MPGVLRRVSSPPSSCASSRLMARPRPVPPYLRLVEASACWKASNTIFCFSTGMPTPVSVTSKATTDDRLVERRVVGTPAGPHRQHAQPDAALGGELQRVGQQVLQDLLQALGVGDQAARPVWDRAGRRTSGPAIRPGGGTAAPRVSSTLVKKISSASTVTVPDSILERSRMSVIRFSRSVPAPWMVRANSTCLGLRLPSGLSASCWPRIRMRVERRAQLVAHVGQELRLVARGQRQLGRPSLPPRGGPARSPGSCARPRCSARRAAAPSARAARWSAAARPAALCSSPASFCDCCSRLLGLHGRLRSCSARCRSRRSAARGRRGAAAVKWLSEASSITALTWPSNSTGSTMMLLGRRPRTGPSVIGTYVGGMSVIRICRLSARALADQALADAERARDGPAPPASA